MATINFKEEGRPAAIVDSSIPANWEHSSRRRRSALFLSNWTGGYCPKSSTEVNSSWKGCSNWEWSRQRCLGNVLLRLLASPLLLGRIFTSMVMIMVHLHNPWMQWPHETFISVLPDSLGTKSSFRRPLSSSTTMCYFKWISLLSMDPGSATKSRLQRKRPERSPHPAASLPTVEILTTTGLVEMLKALDTGFACATTARLSSLKSTL